jgi:hypothetical protein
MSRLASVLAAAFVAASAPAQYCAVANSATCASDEWISSFALGSFSHASPCVAGGYDDQTALPPIPLVPNVATPVSVSVANWFDTDRVTIWIDLDDDGVFGAGEDFDLPDVSVPGGFGLPQTVAGTLTVPGVATPRVVRLRVALAYGLADPQPACGAHTYAYWRDYRVSIAPVPGDDCSQPLPAFVGYSQIVYAAGLTHDGPAVCGDAPANLWLSFVPGRSGAWTVGVPLGSGFSLRSVRAGGCAGTPVLLCGSSTFTPVPMTAGVEYLLEIAVAAGATSFVVLGVLPPPVGAADECAGAVPVGDGTLPNIPLYGATASAEPFCGYVEQDLWFSYVATSAHVRFDLRAGQPGALAGALGVFAACGAAPLYCAYDANGGAVRIDAALIPGRTYRIRVGASVSQTSAELEISTPYGAGLVTEAPGELYVVAGGATPGAPCLTALTLNAGAYPHGSFFGVDIGFSDLVAQIFAGPPFVATPDAAGELLQGPFVGLPSGLTLYGVALDAFLNGGFTPSAPFSATVK